MQVRCNSGCLRCQHKDCVNNNPPTTQEIVHGDLMDKQILEARQSSAEWHCQGVVHDKAVRSKLGYKALL